MPDAFRVVEGPLHEKGSLFPGSSSDFSPFHVLYSLKTVICSIPTSLDPAPPFITSVPHIMLAQGLVGIHYMGEVIGGEPETLLTSSEKSS